MSILLSCNSSSKAVDSATTQNSSDSPKSEKYCFLKAENQDTLLIALTVQGDTIYGEMSDISYQKDAAVGTLVGNSVLYQADSKLYFLMKK